MAHRGRRNADEALAAALLGTSPADRARLGALLMVSQPGTPEGEA